MKAKIYFIIFLCLVFGCKKDEEGTIVSKFKFTTAPISKKSTAGKSDSTYTQFGDYITSLSPGYFSAKLSMLSLGDSYSAGHAINFIYNQNNDPNYVQELNVDFSNNQEISLTPRLESTDMAGNLFGQKEVTLVYFIFSAIYFYQELELPAQYENVVINQFNEVYNEHYSLGGSVQYYCDSVKTGTTLKIRNTPFVSRLFTGNAGYTNTFVFGNTTSSFIFNAEGNLVTTSPDFPFAGEGNFAVIRSDKFAPKTIIMPETEETLELYSTISFNTENLIQVYAGQDNIPYTSDDIFVYAPNYWERVGVRLDVNLN